MRRIGIGLLAGALVSISAPAFAKDMNGRFGVGGLTNTLGQQGFSFKYWAGHLGVNLLLGGNRTGTKYVPEGADVEATRTVTNLDSALRVMFNAARAKDANMYVGGGIAVGSTSTDAGVSGVDKAEAAEVAFELVIGAEYFFSNHFAVQAEVGLPIRLVGEDGPAIVGGAGTGNPGGEGNGVVFGQVAAWGAGFSFYF